MFSKLALKNVTRSIRDFAVYFLTLTFGVCLFYVFNSIDAQQAMLQLTESKKSYVLQMIEMMSYVSVFVAVVLGLLIVYANRFLMKRRKRELGLYLLMGMRRGAISRLLIGETLLIGLFALGVGLAIGVFASQIMSVFTARLFEADMTSFRFVVSPGAVGKTVACFAVIFLVVMAFNTVMVSRCRLIDLLAAGKKNENPGVGNVWVSVGLFALAVLALGWAYLWVLDTGMFSESLGWQILLGCVGTVLFFASLSGFLVKAAQLFPGFYYRNLNCFILRQVNSKINTVFFSMSVICLMLFVTICALAGGLGMSEAFSLQSRQQNPYGASFYYLVREGKPTRDIALRLQQDGVPLEQFARSWSQADLRSAPLVLEEQRAVEALLALGYTEEMIRDQADFSQEEGNVLSLSQYNAARRLANLPEARLEPGRYLLCVPPGIAPVMEAYRQAVGTVTLGGVTYQPGPCAVVEEPLSTGISQAEGVTVVLTDEEAEQYPLSGLLLNVQLKEGMEDGAALKQALANVYTQERAETEDDWRPYDVLATRQAILDQGVGVKSLILFLAVYIGLVFLITSAAVLSLQQLSEAADNAGRYRLLRKLGAKEKTVRRALYAQIGIYLALPMALAVLHSAVGLEVVRRSFQSAVALDIGPSALATAGLLLVVYGGYFLATCFGAQSIVRGRRPR